MITATEMSKLHTAISGLDTNGRGSLRADLIEAVYALTFDSDDLDDLYQTAEEIVTIAGYIRDNASENIQNAQQDRADMRADLAYDNYRCSQ